MSKQKSREEFYERFVVGKYSDATMAKYHNIWNWIEEDLEQREAEGVDKAIDIIEKQGRYDRGGHLVTSNHETGEWIHRGDTLQALKELKNHDK